MCEVCNGEVLWDNLKPTRPDKSGHPPLKKEGVFFNKFVFKNAPFVKGSWRAKRD